MFSDKLHQICNEPKIIVRLNVAKVEMITSLQTSQSELLVSRVLFRVSAGRIPEEALQGTVG